MEGEQQCVMKLKRWGPRCPNMGVPEPPHKLYVCESCQEEFKRIMAEKYRQKLINRHLYN